MCSFYRNFVIVNTVLREKILTYYFGLNAQVPIIGHMPMFGLSTLSNNHTKNVVYIYMGVSQETGPLSCKICLIQLLAYILK